VKALCLIKKDKKMKKYVLFLAIISCACFSFAQILKINQMEENEEGRVFIKEIKNGDTIQMGTEESFVEFDSDVINNSDVSHSIGLKMEVVDGYTDGIDISACWDECLAPWNFRFEEVTIAAGKTEPFKVDYSTNGIPDSKALVSCTFLVDGVEEIFFYVRFGDADVSVKESVITTIKAYPNPATSVVNIDYALNKRNAQIALYNILGVPVYEQPLRSQEGTVKINVSDFAPGIYFYMIKVDGKSIETKKLIISR
jgi:hypothetical protein